MLFGLKQCYVWRCFNLQSAPKSVLALVDPCGQFQALSGNYLTMLTATVLSWLLFFVTAHAYETWHLVDLSQVICPKPTSSMTDAPEFPEYNLGINYTNELQVDAPHIVGFIRASKQAVSITFKIEDFYGEQVQQICKSPRDHMAIWCNLITLDLIRWIFDVLMSTKSIRDPCGFHRQVVPETTMELQEGSDAIPSACSCTNPNVPPEVSATYGASFDLWWCGSGI